MDAIELQRQGASARALGKEVFDNPFYETAAMPAKTGESIPDWEAKALAWDLGWRCEDLIRCG